jgi:hypothetical protein
VGAEFSLGETDRRFPAESTLRGEKPGAGVIRSFQDIGCPIEEPNKPDHAVGFLRIKSTVDLAPVEGGARDPKDRAEVIERNAKRSLQLLHLFKGEAFPDSLNQRY